MYRKRDSQSSLFGTSNLMPESKTDRLAKTWAAPFRERALPLIEEDELAHLYCADNGRPNRPVQTVFGVLLLKEMQALTDAEALEQLEFNVLWHHALDLTLEEAHLPQKTLHNFRARLMADDQGQLAFQATTGRILAALGTEVGGKVAATTAATSLTAADFDLGEEAEGVSRCPAGHTPTQQTPHGKSGRCVTLHFERSTCETCPLHPYCPVSWKASADAYQMRVDRLAVNRARRRRDQARSCFRKCYAVRAGIEATNSELKRAHGLGHLRVRGRPRVTLAAYLKGLGCNFNRMVRVLLRAAVGQSPASA
jgi:hypothetical protein